MKKIVLSLCVTLGLSLPMVGFANEVALQTQADEKMQDIWIDVRSPEEFAEGHLEGALNIPFDQISSRISAVTTDNNAEINLYCRSGRRADVALETLQGLGFTNVTNQGSYADLVGKGMK